MKQVGERIRQLRVERGMTQQELASKLFVTRQTVCRWENNEREPDLEKVVSISEVFETSIDQLLKP